VLQRAEDELALTMNTQPATLAVSIARAGCSRRAASPSFVAGTASASIGNVAAGTFGSPTR
jgi:hypothetical protein